MYVATILLSMMLETSAQVPQEPPRPVISRVQDDPPMGTIVEIVHWGNGEYIFEVDGQLVHGYGVPGAFVGDFIEFSPFPG